MSALMASFATEAALLEAVDRLGAAGFEEVETYTPVPVADLKEDRLTRLLPSGVMIGGLLGAAFMYGLECLSTVSNWGYPVDIGGRPKFSWPAYIPIAVAFGLLCAGLAALVLHMTLSPPWRLWDPVDEFDELRGASRDRWIVHVHVEAEADLLRAGVIVAPLRPIAVRTVSPELEEVPA